ncbi:hypothetical protein C3L29_040805, partial [Pseudomonas sp. MWU12-2534b]
TQADGHGQAAPFPAWRSYYPEAVLRSIGFQSRDDAHPAARALVADMRSALRLDAASEMDPHSPFAALARARDAALREAPGEGRQPYEAPVDAAQWAVLKQGLNRHPQSEQLRGQVRRLARLTNLARGGWPQDSAVQRLLQWGLAAM